MQVEEELVWTKESSKKWYLKFDRFITKQSYSRYHFDYCVMQEHLSTSASQPASHVSEFKSRVEERRSPHLKFE
jgi:hypothetical protein